MHLVRLELNNYRRFEEVTVEFPDGVVGMIGPNGAGKSSLVEAIAWALYGNEVARSSKEEIKRLGAPPSESCYVILDFEMNGDNYRVVRELKGVSNTADAAVFINQRPQARGVTASSELIEKTLGMDWKSFLVSFFARQRELNALTEYQPAKRIEVLSRMLGIERIESAIKMLRQDKRDCQTKLETTRGFMVDVNQLQQQLQIKQSQQLELKSKIGQKEVSLKQTQSEFGKLSQEFVLSKSRRETFTTLQKESEVRQSQLQGMTEQIRGLVNEKEEILNLIPLQEELKPYLEKHSQLAQGLLEQEKLKQKSSTRKSLEEQIKAHQELLRQDQNRLKALESDLALVEKIQKIHQENIQRLLQIESELEKQQQQFNLSSAEEKSVNDQIKKLQQQLQRIEELGPESLCDRCLRPLGKDFDQIREHILEETEKLNSQRQTLTSKREQEFQNIQKTKADKEKVQNQKDLYQGKLKQLEQASLELQNLQQRIAQSSLNLDNFSKACQQLGTEQYQPEIHLQLQEELRRVEGKKQEYLQVSEKIKTLPQMEKKLREMENKKRELEQDLARITVNLNQLGFDLDQFQRRETELEQKRQQVHQSQLDLKDFRFAELALSQEIRQIEEKIKENQLFQKQVQDLEEQRRYLERLDSIMADFKLHLIGRIRPALSAITKGLIAEMTEGKYTDLELDENYEIYIYDSGQKFGLERFSGGEKDLANLCLRLAISLLISQSAGTEFSFIVLDEIFGSQDQQRKESILKALGNLRNRFRQIILITHIEDIKDQVESLINVVENPDGTSRIEANLAYD